jgi:DNA-binding GntR family transcriptional regulator
MPIPQGVDVPTRTLLRDRAFTVLRDAIVDGTLEPGEQLRELELQRWIGVSRTPIREALMRLQHAGLVVTRPGHSTVVSQLDSKAVRDAEPVVAAMHELAVHLSVPLLTAEHLTAMRAANHAFADALDRDDVEAALAADDALHAVCVVAADNLVISDVLEQYSPLLRRAERVRFSSKAGRDSVDLHDQMIAACEDGDAARAATIARNTWQALAATGADDPVSAGHGILRLHSA